MSMPKIIIDEKAAAGAMPVDGIGTSTDGVFEARGARRLCLAPK